MRGSCECGSVVFESDGPWRDVTICHCSQCRKTSGHLWAATSVPFETLRFVEEGTLAWYESSDSARRGFCATCGSSLFYKQNDSDHIAIAPGSLDGPTGLSVARNIFTDSKGDYYEIADDRPQLPD